MLSVKLTDAELKAALDVAHARNRSQRDGNRRDGKVVSDSLGIDVQGATAELAVSKAFGIEWDGKFFNLAKWFDWRVNGHDVSGLEVRSTHHPSGSLILHPKDADYSPFVLVLVHRKPVFEIVGWVYGIDGKKPEYWRDVGYGRPCFYVPQKKLRPIAELYDARSEQGSA